MASLIAVNDRFVVKYRPVFFDQSFDRLDYERDLKALTDLVRQDLACERIEDR